MLMLDETAAEQVKEMIKALVEQRDSYKLALERAEGTIHRLKIANDALRQEVADARRTSR